MFGPVVVFERCLESSIRIGVWFAMKLTLARINSAKIPPGAHDLKLWDGAVGGLYLRLLPGGGRSWVFRYRTGGGGRSAKVRSIKIGNYPTLSIDAARDVARAHAAQVAGGKDPAQLCQEKRRREQATLGRLLAVEGPYEASLIARHVVKRKEVLSSLRRGLTKLMDVDVARLTRLDFVGALDTLRDQPGAMADLRKHIHRWLEWCVNAGLVQSNVLAGMRMAPKTRAERLKEASRRRALQDEEIAGVWCAAEVYGKFGSLVQLALLTGMRRNELATLRWSDIHVDRIVLSAAVTKTSAQHEIPLTALMCSILKRQPRTTSPLVFPSDRTGGPMSAWSWMKVQLVLAADVGPWSLHDLRRTCRSLMSRLGIAEPVGELAIGHVKGSLVGFYDLEKQWGGRVDAFEQVSIHIARLIAG